MLILLLCLCRYLTEAFNATRIPLPRANVTLFEPPLPISARYTNTHYEWEETGASGQIVMPWTVTANYPVDKIPVLRKAMTMLEEDVVCMEYPEVDRDSLSTSTWKNGIVFVYENELTEVGCYSMVGAWSGWSDGSVFGSIGETGAPTTWQMIALATECGGDSVATIQHEVMHALGFPHEHQVLGNFRKSNIKGFFALATRS